uniref:Protein polybromo-1 n=2 Tax=Talaromyces marneffei PM1 TaxID=1077442 RepID=A0A093V0T9_TALMA
MSMRRKFTSTGPEPTTLPESKRRKVSDDKTDDIETPQKTTKVGLKLIDDIKHATDKSGRIIASNFYELPDKKKYPDYYKVIGLPISLNQVIVSERNNQMDKLNKHRYATLTELESDLKRLVSNAKKYNEKGTMLFADAERIRKIVTGTMPKINPAYNDPNYIPFPTPIPDQNEITETPENEDGEEDGDNQEDNAEADAEDDKASDQELDQGEDEELNFEGDTIQLAQDKIISEMIPLRDDRGREVGGPFLYKPDKNLYKEYYEIIQHPVSLRSILKQVRGIEGRKPHSHKTAFPTWQLFADEMEYVWGNAREFNEEDSEIVDLVNILEAHFKRRLAEAKSVVPDDPIDESNPRIKLKLGMSKTPEPRLTLKFAGQKASSVEDKTPASASLDGDSVQRPGSAAHRDTPDSSRLGGLGQSPMPGKIISPSPSQTPMPSTAGAGLLNPSIGGSDQISSWPIVPQRPSYASVQSLFRKADEDVSEALIKNLTIQSHSSLGPHPKFYMNIPASPVMRQQSVVVNIPAPQSFVSLSLSIAPNSAQRRTKLVALFGPQRAPISPLPHSNPSELGYDIRLAAGLTKIDFQVVSHRNAGQEGVNGNIHGRANEEKRESLTVFFRVIR